MTCVPVQDLGTGVRVRVLVRVRRFASDGVELSKVQSLVLLLSPMGWVTLDDLNYGITVSEELRGRIEIGT